MWPRRTGVWLFGLAALALTAGGCVIATGSDSGSFAMTWNVSFIGGSQRVSCADADTPKLELTATHVRTGETTVDTFACEAGGGESRLLRPGAYSVRLALKSSDGTVVSAIDGDFDLGRHGAADLGIVEFKVQSFMATWIVTRDRQAASCAQVGGVTVRLITQLGNDPPLNYDFPCADGGGETAAVPIGVYSVTLQLLDRTAAVLSATGAMPFTATGKARAVFPAVTFCTGRCT